MRLRPMLLALLSVATLLAGGRFVWTHAHATSEDWRAEDVVEMPAHFRLRMNPTPLHLVVLGDSVATGAGCNCRPFGPTLAHEAAEATGRSTTLSILAHDGMTSGDLLSQVQSDGETITALRRATTVTVTIGANDFDSSQADAGCPNGGTSCFAGDLQALPGRMAGILGRIRALAGPQAQVLVTGYWNVFLDGAVGKQHGSTYTSTSDALTRRVNSVLAAAARAQNATYVDLYGPFHGDGDRDDTKLLADDGDHPSEAGHQLIAHVLAHVVALKG